MFDLFDMERIRSHLARTERALDQMESVVIIGQVTKITGMKIEVTGLSAPIGTLCKILISETDSVNAEVIGFSGDTSYIMAVENIDGVKQGTPVMPLLRQRKARVGMNLLGRVLDAEGNPIDGLGELQTEEYYPLVAKPINPLARKRITEPLDVGIRAINALTTVSKGQRLGIFAGSGVGKSVLLGMMTHFTSADVVVVGLVGERGREVQEFIDQNLKDKGLKKTVVIASPADTSPLMRVNCATLATSIAEYYRDKGLDVLLIVDSLTRFAQAHREISLSAGELPATKGFTPSVFAKLSQLIERSGNGMDTKGSITAFYTILVEDEDISDPIADHVRSVLDGHIILSRKLADAAHYPAIDIERSISRVMTSVVDANHLKVANKFKQLYSTYMQNKELINVGMYQAGSDKLTDEAILRIDAMNKFLVQAVEESSSLIDSVSALCSIFNGN
jgi:flagellum-specific ATP synthase